jgi:hypothetical protein
MLRKERQVSGKQTGGAVLHYVTNQSVGMRKGSVFVRRVAPKGLYAVLVVCGFVVRQRHESRKTTE